MQTHTYSTQSKTSWKFYTEASAPLLALVFLWQTLLSSTLTSLSKEARALSTNDVFSALQAAKNTHLGQLITAQVPRNSFLGNKSLILFDFSASGSVPWKSQGNWGIWAHQRANTWLKKWKAQAGRCYIKGNWKIGAKKKKQCINAGIFTPNKQFKAVSGNHPHHQSFPFLLLFTPPFCSTLRHPTRKWDATVGGDKNSCSSSLCILHFLSFPIHMFSLSFNGAVRTGTNLGTSNPIYCFFPYSVMQYEELSGGTHTLGGIYGCVLPSCGLFMDFSLTSVRILCSRRQYWTHSCISVRLLLLQLF